MTMAKKIDAVLKQHQPRKKVSRKTRRVKKLFGVISIPAIMTQVMDLIMIF